MTITPPEAQLTRESTATGNSPLTRRQGLKLLGFLIATTVVIVGSAIAVTLLVPAAREHSTVLLAAALPVHATALLAVLHIGLRRAGTGWRALGFTRPTKRILHLLWQMPVVLAVLIAAQMLATSLTGSTPGYKSGGVPALAAGAGPVVALLVFAGAAVLTPVWEEAVFRGIIHGGLRRRFGWIGASFFSAAAFAAAHGVPMLLPYMITLGVSLSLLREFHKTLWAPVILHASLNALVVGAIVLA